MATAPPNLIAQFGTAYDTTTSPKTSASITVLTGDVIVVVASDEGTTTAYGTPTGSAGSFTYNPVEINDGGGTGFSGNAVWAATASSGQTLTISVTQAGAIWWGFEVYQYRGSDGIGAHDQGNGSGTAPSRTFSTSFDHSAILCVNSDGFQTDGSSRVWRTINSIIPTAANGLEDNYLLGPSHYTTYAAHYTDAGTAGSITTGLSAPGGQSWALTSVEVRGSTWPTSSDLLLNPFEDTSNAGAWVTDTGATLGLYAAIDEDSASDADYVTTPAGPVSAVYETAVQGHADPATSAGHILHVRYKKDISADVMNLVVNLVEGSTVRVTRTYNGITTSFVTADEILTGVEADSITDYNNLRVRFTATAVTADPAKVADRATLNSTTAGTAFDYVLTSLTVGNVLIIRTAADNAGTAGAASTVTVTNQSGTAINAGTVQQFQANADPGAASAGITCNVIVAAITATSGTVRLTYGNTLVQSGVAEEWSGFSGTVVGTPVTATNAATAQPSVTDASVASGNVAYVAVAAEGPNTDTYTADSDTTNGSWVTLTKLGQNSGTATSDTTTTGAYKITTGTGAQAWDNATHTNTRDTAAMIVELARAAGTSKAVVSWSQLEIPWWLASQFRPRTVAIRRAVSF